MNIRHCVQLISIRNTKESRFNIRVTEIKNLLTPPPNILPVSKSLKSCQIVHACFEYLRWWVLQKSEENRDFSGFVSLHCCWRVIMDWGEGDIALIKQIKRVLQDYLYIFLLISFLHFYATIKYIEREGFGFVAAGCRWCTCES